MRRSDYATRMRPPHTHTHAHARTRARVYSEALSIFRQPEWKRIFERHRCRWV